MLAEELNLNIEEDADELINQGSPSGSRQILRKYNVKHEYVPFSFSDLMMPTPFEARQDSFANPLYTKRSQAIDKEKARQSAENHSDFSSSSFCSSSSSE